MGKIKGLLDLIRFFPRLRSVDHERTSEPCLAYNCIAHAADDAAHKWDCTAGPPDLPLPAGFYWPEGAKRGGEIDALISAFRAIGYELCGDSQREVGYEKVALYADNSDGWTHAAKQRIDGHWSSKLGDAEDIRHATAEALGGSDYGEVAYYMRRRRISNESKDQTNQPTE